MARKDKDYYLTKNRMIVYCERKKYMDINKYLEKLDKLIDLEHLKESQGLQEDAWDFKPVKKFSLS